MPDPRYFVHLAVDHDEEFDPHNWLPALDRRSAVRMIGMGALAAVAGCGSGGTASTLSKTASSATVATSVKLTPSVTSTTTGTSVTCVATVVPSTATGTVTFYNGTTWVGSATLTSGTATCTTSFPSAGTASLTAVYAGDSTCLPSTSSPAPITVTGSGSCSQSLEGEEGPFFVDDSATGYNRSNIVSNLDGSNTQSGIPFVLTLYVCDGKNSCAAMQSVQVDIWQCNAAGVYSAESSESTVGQSWLRGYQLTDLYGKVQFTTIIPGWYSGRTYHIHLRLRSTYDSSSDGGTNTMQLFFDQALMNSIATSVSPYSSEGKNPTTNASDSVYVQQEKGTTLMTLSGSTSAGYSATAQVYLPIATAS